MEFQLPKGMKDFRPSEKLLRNEITETIQRVFEKYGFNPIETPALEKWSTLASKYAGGEEILKETYSLKDQGNRKLGLRYDLTVPLARFVSINQLTKPFKRYQIDKVWRDGPVKTGRYREFTQCDADTVGSHSILSDAEMLAMSKEIFDNLKIDVIIKINNRKLLNEMLKWAGVKEAENAILSIDKLEKMGKKHVLKELKEKGVSANSLEKIEELLNIAKEKASLQKLEKLIGTNQGIKELKELQDYLKTLGVNASVDITLARGLSYYTGTIYEIFAKKGSTSSLAAGGRYDKMVSVFSGKDMPAVGISFGLDIISELLKDKKRKTVLQCLVIPIGNTEEKALEILNYLRKNNINSDMDVLGKSLSKNLNYANKMNIPFVIIAGEKELSKDRFTLRNMNTGQEKEINKKDMSRMLEECEQN